MSKSILIITNYFPPEMGAAANRLHRLATALHDNNIDVQVLCPMPNYPDGKIQQAYRGKFQMKSTMDGLHINRLWIYANNSDRALLRLLSMLSFSLLLFFYVLFSKVPPTVLVQSPPLLVGFFGTLAARLRGRKVILNVSDLWPLAAAELGLMNKQGTTYSIMQWIEKNMYRRADVILGQSQEILDHVSSIVPDTKKLLYRNLPTTSHEHAVKETTSEKLQLFYAGLLGHAQDLAGFLNHVTLPEHVEIHIYGKGAQEAQIKALQNDQIIYHGSLPATQINAAITQHDLALVPLKTRIYGSVPSKIFEYASLGLPVLYIGSGEAATLIEQHQLGHSFTMDELVQFEQYLAATRVVDLRFRESVQKNARTAFNAEEQVRELLGVL